MIFFDDMDAISPYKWTQVYVYHLFCWYVLYGFVLQVFECVMGWVGADLTNREQHLAELMEYVRLPLLSQDYLIQRVEEEPLLKQDSQCK